jgi:hypothetical protein
MVKGLKATRWKVEHNSVSGEEEQEGSHPGSVKKKRICYYCSQLALHGFRTEPTFCYQVNDLQEIGEDGDPLPNTKAAKEMSKRASDHSQKHASLHKKFLSNRQRFDSTLQGGSNLPDGYVNRIVEEAERVFGQLSATPNPYDFDLALREEPYFRCSTVEGVAKVLIAKEMDTQRLELESAVMAKIRPNRILPEHYNEAAISARRANKIYHTPGALYKVEKRHLLSAEKCSDSESPDSDTERDAKLYRPSLGIGVSLSQSLAQVTYKVASRGEIGKKYECQRQLAVKMAKSGYRDTRKASDTSRRGMLSSVKKPPQDETLTFPKANVLSIISALDVTDQDSVDCLCKAFEVGRVTLTTTTTTTVTTTQRTTTLTVEGLDKA